MISRVMLGAAVLALTFAPSALAGLGKKDFDSLPAGPVSGDGVPGIRVSVDAGAFACIGAGSTLSPPHRLVGATGNASNVVCDSKQPLTIRWNDGKDFVGFYIVGRSTPGWIVKAYSQDATTPLQTKTVSQDVSSRVHHWVSLVDKSYAIRRVTIELAPGSDSTGFGIDDLHLSDP